MKLPNGFGSITELSGNRRKPYAVRHHGKYLAYFATFDEAFIFLADYNRDPSIFRSNEITFAQLYKLEMAEREKRIAVKTVKSYQVAFRHCQVLHDRNFAELRTADLQVVIKALSDRDIGQPSQKKARQLMHNLYTYALKYDMVSVDYSQYVDLDRYVRKHKKTPFNTRQLNRVKVIAESDSALADWAKVIVMMCYCGVRPSEMTGILKADVKLGKRFFKIGQAKTESSSNRMVPINPKVLPYFEYWMSKEGKTLITIEGNPISYGQLLRRFDKVMAESRCKHKPHECRHTCATWLDDKEANKLSIKRILGHATGDITDRVYTHKSLRQLKKAIDLL